MKNEPLISIIAPMYNGKDCIERFINCILSQTYTNWELIIVDDGSTDDSVEIVKRLSLNNTRIILIERNRAPKGSVTCRNIGQQVIHGDFFIHLDSDDIVQPFMLEQRLKFMQENPSIDYATSMGESVRVNNDSIVHTGRLWGVQPQKDLLACFLEVDYPFSVWNNIYRTSTMGNYYWDEKVKIYTDFSYIVPCIIDGYKHAFIGSSQVDYFYVVGQKNAMTSSFIAQEKYESTKYLFTKTVEMLKNNTDYKKYIASFRKFFNLQLERVSISGSQDQINDFYEFYKTIYSESKNGRLKALYKICLSKAKVNNYSTRTIRFYIYLFMEPEILIQTAFSKVRCHS